MSRACVAVALSLCLATGGCIGWYSGEASSPDALTPHAPHTVAIAVESDKLGDPMFAKEEPAVTARSELASALTEAGYTVVADRAQAERVVTIRVERVS
ncbi:MAG TPA: hypothetical protein VIF62_15410, partial [Labilithrix sp.]